MKLSRAIEEKGDEADESYRKEVATGEDAERRNKEAGLSQGNRAMPQLFLILKTEEKNQQ